jgi:2-oxoglutarate ferredoxin oxidoreductase subunit alpha
MGWKAFDIADRMQMPVIVMSDLDLGMNEWMAKPFDYPDQAMDRGKILWEDDLQKLIDRQGGKWGRYLDVDDDGIPYRTIMGNLDPRSAYFTRGTGHDEYGYYSEDPEVFERLMQRLARKFETARQYVPQPIISTMTGARCGIIAVGTTDPAIQEARDYLAQAGIPTDYMRILATPFTEEVEVFLREHDHIYVVEMNRDGQLRQILMINFPQYATRLIKMARTNGLPLSARWVKDEILAKEVA